MAKLESKVLKHKAQPRGRFPHAKRAGDFIYVSGTSARRSDNTIDGADADAMGTTRLDIRQQTRATIENVRDILASFDAGLDAFAANDFATARDAFASLRAERPDDADVTAMLRRSNDAIETRLDELADVASALVRSGLLDEADDILSRMRALDASASAVRQTARTIGAARAEFVSGDAPPSADTAPAIPAETPAPTPLTDAERREIADFYQRGVAALESRRSDDAVRYWEFVWSKNPHYERVGNYLAREYVTRGMEAFSRGRFEHAVTEWERAVEIAPEDERARGYLKRAHEQLARVKRLRSDREAKQ